MLRQDASPGSSEVEEIAKQAPAAALRPATQCPYKVVGITHCALALGGRVPAVCVRGNWGSRFSWRWEQKGVVAGSSLDCSNVPNLAMSHLVI